MKYSTLLFDLDGTLTDPKPGITKSVQYALARFGIVQDDLDQLEPFIGPPLVDSFQRFYRFSEAEAWQAVHYYREYFTDRGLYENELYPGISELLTRLAEQGARLYVATSKPEAFAERIVRHFGIASYFQAIVGAELDGARSDKTEIIRHVLQTRQLSQAGAVMIGDRKYDLIGARNNGIASIGVGYGYGGDNELIPAQPTYYCATLPDLAALLLTEAGSSP